MVKDKYIGIDLGGTAIKMGIVNNKGEIIQLLERPTPVKGGYQEIIETFDQMINALLQETKIDWNFIKGVGIGIPGFVDIETGEVIEACNLDWNNIHIKRLLETEWGIPVEVDNDANTAALGEMWAGAGKGSSNILCLTIGTGIGGGVIINGDIYHGANGMAGEIGHFIVNESNGLACNCGKIGCLETEASATAIVKQAMSVVEKSIPLNDIYIKKGKITAKDIVELAREQDHVCQEIITNLGELLGKTLSKFCVLLNPEKIIIGGGVSYAGDLLLNPMISMFKHNALLRISENTSIVKATLGNKAGIIGAAWLVHKSTRNNE